MTASDNSTPDCERTAYRLRLRTAEHNLRPAAPPVPNYTLAEVCPACDTAVYRHACKVRCPRCGFMWDCSEL
ncbi:MAG: hypothetical protein IT298_06970 [Chloroflexi bacterium]|nr:hypothetical protein [Chloroflexota bacterium]MCO6442727.1 hypothetical protein [Anaerolineae bacterium]MDL1914770.1 hypothetical protein [Anaerolineae bacterium CFX4]MCC6565487.1 hypothetical protein [Chloroflexota bacterium]MEB2364729.1 hypothetical protein [Chloroflexota bacterium]